MIPRPAEITAVLVAAAISEFGLAATANALSSQELLLFRLRRTQPARLGGALCFGFSPPAGPTQTFSIPLPSFAAGS